MERCIVPTCRADDRAEQRDAWGHDEQGHGVGRTCDVSVADDRAALGWNAVAAVGPSILPEP